MILHLTVKVSKPIKGKKINIQFGSKDMKT
jgi:hypothetical protein